jgi:hypothetical protein
MGTCVPNKIVCYLIPVWWSHLITNQSFGGTQLREAISYGQLPKYLLRYNNNKSGPCFAHVAAMRKSRVMTFAYKCHLRGGFTFRKNIPADLNRIIVFHAFSDLS